MREREPPVRRLALAFIAAPFAAVITIVLLLVVVAGPRNLHPLPQVLAVAVLVPFIATAVFEYPVFLFAGPLIMRLRAVPSGIAAAGVGGGIGFVVTFMLTGIPRMADDPQISVERAWSYLFLPLFGFAAGVIASLVFWVIMRRNEQLRP